jgi:nuclear GTP-binding protein
VIDSSDVIIQVLDARDPNGTRCPHLEKHLSTERKTKQLIFILNKCDLVPPWVTARWVRDLSKIKPTLAFHSSITNPFGKGSLIQLLRQFSELHKDKKQISVGFVGYPNVGKSSIINTLRAKKVCRVAPLPGETKVWQYITLYKRIFLIDCPGVVYPSGDTETEIVLKGVVRVQNIEDATEHIPTVLQRVRADFLIRAYGITNWEDSTDFLNQYAKKTGKLLKGGEGDVNTCAKMILQDWQRGKIPYFVPPPSSDEAIFFPEPIQDDPTQNENVPLIEQNFNNIQTNPELFDDVKDKEVLPVPKIDYDINIPEIDDDEKVEDDDEEEVEEDDNNEDDD